VQVFGHRRSATKKRRGRCRKWDLISDVVLQRGIRRNVPTTDIAFLIDETTTLGASGHHLQATHSHVRLLTGHKPPAASSLTASVVVTFAANTTPAARDFRNLRLTCAADILAFDRGMASASATRVGRTWP
jgi:hypothetical protein